MGKTVLRGFLAAALALTCGCGLSDYEKRMDEQRERMNLFDEENAALGDLIDMPGGKDPRGADVKIPFEIFLRLPKGMSGTFKERDAIYLFENQPLYRYHGKPDVNVFAAWTRLAEKDAKAKPKEDEALPEDFRRRVRGGLIEFITREYHLSANPPDFNKDLKKDPPREVLRDGRKRKLDFESTVFDGPGKEGPTRFLVYFDAWNDRQGAIVYQIPVQQASQYMRGVDISLKTLEIANIAQAQRAAFRRKK